MQRIDDLQLNGLKIIQDDDLFSFGIDAVLLSDFANTTIKDKVLDIGTGIGILPILLVGKKKAKKVIGIEIQKEVADIALLSVKLNKLEDKVEIINEDIKKYNSELFDAIITNPPYMLEDAGKKSQNEKIAIARTEVKLKLGELLNKSSKLLKENGRMYMIHRPNRLVDILSEARMCRLEPKKLRFIKPYFDKKTNLVLIELCKGARPFLIIEEDLVIYDKKGEYTEEIMKIYNKVRK